MVTKIITDTTSCLPAEYAVANGIPVIPQVIVFGEDSYLEGVDLDIRRFMERLSKSPELPKTAAPPPELFIKAFAELTPLNEPILCIHPSSEVSGTVRSAMIAAEEFPSADIRVIDTRLVASPIAILVQLAVEWAAKGINADEIEARIRRMAPTCKIYFLVSTLDFLARGGRIGGAQALLASILQIKPILVFRDGKVDQFEKARTQKHALNRLKELVRQQYPSDEDGYLTVLQAGVPEQGQALANELSTMLGLPPVPVFDMPPAIVTHGGPGILGVTFFYGK
jgi:DegV family protein with EDD domain